MEFLEGGEVWSHLQDERTKASVGCYESLAKFWIAEAINALEYMHKYFPVSSGITSLLGKVSFTEMSSQKI